MTLATKIRTVFILWTAIIAVPLLLLSAAILIMWVISTILPIKATKIIEVVAEPLINLVDRLFRLRAYKVRYAEHTFDKKANK